METNWAISFLRFSVFAFCFLFLESATSEASKRTNLMQAGKVLSASFDSLFEAPYMYIVCLRMLAGRVFSPKVEERESSRQLVFFFVAIFESSREPTKYSIGEA